MASWSETTKHEPSSINRGQRYEKGDRVSREQLNTITENSFYAVNKSDEANANSKNALTVANNAFEQSKVTGTQVTVGGVFQSIFDADTKADNEKVSQLSNPNLLINPDFSINQRGQTTYTRDTEGSTYTFDRWCLISGTLTKVANGIEVAPGTKFQQFFELTDTFKNNVVGKNVTFSFSLFGQPHQQPTTFNLSGSGEVMDYNGFNVSIEINTGDNQTAFIRFYNATGNIVTLNWAKLELGTIATQFVPRPYAEELAICQRYYYKMSTNNNSANYANVIYYTNTGARQTINFPQTMRIIPTFSQNGNFKVTTSSGTFPVTAWGTQGFFGNALVITATTSSVDIYSIGILQARNDTNTYLAFDAEIY